MGCQSFQQQIFTSAFGGGGRIGRDVAGAAVQQAVVAARGAGIDVLFFNQHAVNPAQGQIPGQAGSGNAAADNEYLGIQRSPLSMVRVDHIFSGWRIYWALFFSCENKKAMLRHSRHVFQVHIPHLAML